MIRTSISILLSLQLLLAGVPWNVRTHWCGGHVAERTFFGGSPGCGMEEEEANGASEEPSIAAVPCCANDVLQLDAVPAFIKIMQELGSTPAVPIQFVTRSALTQGPVPSDVLTHPLHPPDTVPRGRDILVRAQRFLI